MRGVCMAWACCVHAVCMVRAWHEQGVCMVCAWCVHGVGMACPRYVHLEVGIRPVERRLERGGQRGKPGVPLRSWPAAALAEQAQAEPVAFVQVFLRAAQAAAVRLSGAGTERSRSPRAMSAVATRPLPWTVSGHEQRWRRIAN